MPSIPVKINLSKSFYLMAFLTGSSQFLPIFVVLVASSNLAHGVLYNVDFNGNSFGSPNATFSGAAVVGASGDFWNGVDGTPAVLALVPAISGSPTITMTPSLPAGSGTYAENSASPFFGTTFADLMGAHIYLSNPTAAPIFTFSGFEPGTPFSLTIYTVGDPDTGKGGTFSTNGGAPQSNVITTANTFTNNSNYVVLSGTTTGAGEVVLSGNLSSGNEYLINGFQLDGTPVPEPTASLLGALALGVGLSVRRRTVR